MAMQKLSNDIQLLFCATNQICSYKRAVEELVYNSLDADSTSIAIRVNIDQNTIQVIDNGRGVSKSNFTLLGERHATSKYVDLSTLKSAPNKYGYRGQSLASIIGVSQSVTITSRCEDTEEMTWVKRFYKGKEQKSCKTLKRPSKGTTIDIKGFMYNLKIQRKAVDSLKELNDIKCFLEQISLVHNNISLSIRDDTKNEIIFKVHKNRDIYQTIFSMFAIERKNLKELIVEKNDYKVTAYIGEKENELVKKNWVYLNGKVLKNSKIQKIINDNLTKCLKLNFHNKSKVKSKNVYNQEDDDYVSKTGIPFYLFFITCPYYDYDISDLPKQTNVEFRNWDPINKLIEKMVKFYVGDINVTNLKTIKKQVINEQKTDDTRQQVKKIMDKILGMGTNSRKIGVSQMKNGIKGKVTKRKPKKNKNKIIITKTEPSVNDIKSKAISNKMNSNKDQKEFHGIHPIKSKVLKKKDKHKNSQLSKKVQDEKLNSLKVPVNNIKTKTDKIKPNIIKTYQKKKNKDNNEKKLNETKKGNKKLICSTLREKCRRRTLNKNIKSTAFIKKLPKTRNICKNAREDKVKSDMKCNNNKLLNIFAKDPTGSVKTRCKALANNVDNLMSFRNKRKRKIFINETVHYSKIMRNNKNYSVRKKIGEIVIHDYIPKPQNVSPCTFDDRTWHKANKGPSKSSYDLVKTILRTRETRNSYIDDVKVDNNKYMSPNLLINDLTSPSDKFSKPHCTMEDTQTVPDLPRLTFESHNYKENNNQISHNYVTKSVLSERKDNAINTRFITTLSKDNFSVPKTRKVMLSKIKNFKVQGNQLHVLNKRYETLDESSYSIEFSSYHKGLVSGERAVGTQNTPSDLMHIQSEIGTYTMKRNDGYENGINIRINPTYTINQYSNNDSVQNEKNISAEDYENKDYIEDSTEKMLCCGDSVENYNFSSMIQNIEETNKDFVVMSRSQEQQLSSDIVIQKSLDKPVDSNNVCELVQSEDNFQINNANLRKLNDSLFIDDFDVDSFLCDRNVYTQKNFESTDVNMFNTSLPNLNSKASDVDFFSIKEKGRTNSNCIDLQEQAEPKDKNKYQLLKSDFVKKDTNYFKFNSRFRFVPKGMSQIFKKCKSKNVCDYNLEDSYYEEEIYDNFVNEVQFNCNMLLPEVQNVKEVTTKAIETVNSKLNKDNASLIFDGESLKRAKVLKQIDKKFIAAEITGKSHHLLENKEYLVLFDQHAVHERIRLENNLSEYFNDNKWKSMLLDNIKLKLSKDEILYLHNYKDKFNQLGLHWTVLSNYDVTINAIPEAILGKNPRQVEIVMKAVKNLIAEEIDAIKSQSGCISLYPKAIMDLVFSEACRYAIKFGDHLSKNECVDLLNSLSECKTPFQCAHGRPVLAVLMDIKKDVKEYKINMKSIQDWIKTKKKIKRM